MRADRAAGPRAAAARARARAAGRTAARAGRRDRAIERLSEDGPLVPGALYGLRAWAVTGEPGAEELVGAYAGVPWPPGRWLEATCSKGQAHAAPGHDCTCGIYALHPRPGTARRVLAVRGRIGGIVEATGAVEVHEEGFRAERARPYALMIGRRNPALVRRLAAHYGAELIDSRDEKALLAFCRERGLGLDEDVVRSLIGAEELERLHRERIERARGVAARVTGLVVITGAIVRASRAGSTSSSSEDAD